MTIQSSLSGSVRRTTVAGIVLMLAGVFLFALNDAIGKWLVATYSVGEILLIRSAVALGLLMPFLWREGLAAFRAAPRPGLQVLRVAISTTEVACFFWSVGYLPLADVMTYYLASPVYVTALAAILLKEKVGWRRWSAVLVGFAGVLLALRPSAATLTWPAMVALAGSLLYAVLLTMTRVLRTTSNTVLISGQIGSTLAFGAVLAPFGWVAPSGHDLVLLLMFGALAIVALACVNRSLKLAAASIVVPYQYTMIVWGVVLGFLVFGDVPGLNVVAGAAIIIAAGLYIFLREQAMAKPAAPFTPPP